MICIIFLLRIQKNLLYFQKNFKLIHTKNDLRQVLKHKELKSN